MRTDEVRLLDGEKIRWEGRPVARHVWRLYHRRVKVSYGTSIVQSAAGLLLLLFTGFLPPGFVPIWILVVVCASIGQLVFRAMALSRTRYVLTDRRILVIKGFPLTRVTSRYLRQLRPAIAAEGRDGTGNLAFGEFPPWWYGHVRMRRREEEHAANLLVLYKVPEIRKVLESASSLADVVGCERSVIGFQRSCRRWWR
ncbi:hypothetical protein [Rugosimonospora africana]|uniref:PH domain-containing protein n=1 Tax=Rugosimonospora africana TaxID=556532 RepID=A0A8J3R0Q3_9ACTN|nr:hypothetical protein [Rugosimonospora africana]GIH20071.1 hypothetical protein Raf01_82430 [Rugosimonospora africana]